jgi:hypothetical protein
MVDGHLWRPKRSILSAMSPFARTANVETAAQKRIDAGRLRSLIDLTTADPVGEERGLWTSPNDDLSSVLSGLTSRSGR